MKTKFEVKPNRIDIIIQYLLNEYLKTIDKQSHTFNFGNSKIKVVVDFIIQHSLRVGCYVPI